MPKPTAVDFDVAIVGGGPAGLSAALILSRARRRVIVLDHAKPRNAAARAVHGFLGQDGATPWEIRAQGRREASRYGAEFRDQEVTAVCRVGGAQGPELAFSVEAAGRQLTVRAVLFATGMIDELPPIPGLRECYGASVHHCPFCDGWEHRDKRLAALGSPDNVSELARMLLGWSADVIALSNGKSFSDDQQQRLRKLGIACREDQVRELTSRDGFLSEILFTRGPGVSCDALFFSSGQGQRSKIPQLLGCECDDEGLLVTKKKHCTNLPGVYIVGDADGDVQFAIVAAAEGAIAATAIHQALLDADQEL